MTCLQAIFFASPLRGGALVSDGAPRATAIFWVRPAGERAGWLVLAKRGRQRQAYAASSGQVALGEQPLGLGQFAELEQIQRVELGQRVLVLRRGAVPVQACSAAVCFPGWLGRPHGFDLQVLRLSTVAAGPRQGKLSRGWTRWHAVGQQPAGQAGYLALAVAGSLLNCAAAGSLPECAEGLPVPSVWLLVPAADQFSGSGAARAVVVDQRRVRAAVLFSPGAAGPDGQVGQFVALHGASRCRSAAAGGND